MTEEVAFTPEDLIDHHAVAAVFRDSSDQILMMRHGKWGFWTIPIGKAHQGQTPFDSLVEEMQDELGVTVTSAEDVRQGELEYFREGHPVRLVMHVFEVKAHSGKIVNKEPLKHAELRYMTVAEIAQEPKLSDATLLFLEAEDVRPLASWTARRLMSE